MAEARVKKTAFRGGGVDCACGLDQNPSHGNPTAYPTHWQALSTARTSPNVPGIMSKTTGASNYASRLKNYPNKGLCGLPVLSETPSRLGKH